MEIVIKAASALLIGSVLALVLKKDSPIMALLLTAAAVFAAVSLSAGALEEITEFLRTLSDEAGVTSAGVSAVLKTTGIAIVTKIASGVCRDASQTAASEAVELTGSIAALFTAMPFMRAVFDMVKSLL